MKKTIQLVCISAMHFSPWLPYSSGCLISYCRRIPEINDKYEFTDPIFRYEDVSEYDEALRSTDILGVTCYVWNQAYHDKLVKRFKEINPNGVVVYGGPNIPEVQQQAMNFLNERPAVDILFIGPGEKNFANWLLGKSEEGTITRSKYNVDFKRMKRDYQVAAADMPTPYIDGIFDNIIKNSDTGLKASFETNRGCPYHCAFCDWGGQAQSKLSVFDFDKIKDQIDYIYSNEKVVEIELLDANLGILPRDVDLIRHMVDRQEFYNNDIKLGYAGLAKNGSKYVPEILNLIGTSINIDKRNQKLSFQTHTKQVLENIDRGNINNDKLLDLLKDCKAKNITTTSEFIMALPGETAETWLDSIARNHELQIDYIRTYVLNYVPNTTMYKPEYRERFNITAKKIRFPLSLNQIGYKTLHENPNYTSNDFTDYEEHEIMTGCSSWDLEEIIKMYDYTWWYHNMWNAGALRSVVSDNIKDDITQFFDNLDDMPFLKSIVEKHRSIVRLLYRPGELEEISDLGTYLFWSKCGRTDDIHQMWSNTNDLVLELGEIYGYKEMSKCVEDYQRTFSLSLYGTDATILEDQDKFLINTSI
jgi:radical SAM superfamily enzyme YgiQ (UPF0313 family)|tara:strand:- start:11449 stop:13212 length:1764 start_codon:yes stop_codon:yes gene_type:complete